jgi:hypothetical protein
MRLSAAWSHAAAAALAARELQARGFDHFHLARETQPGETLAVEGDLTEANIVALVAKHEGIPEAAVRKIVHGFDGTARGIRSSLFGNVCGSNLSAIRPRAGVEWRALEWVADAVGDELELAIRSIASQLGVGSEESASAHVH